MRAHASRPAVPCARQQQADGSRLTSTPARAPGTKTKRISITQHTLSIHPPSPKSQLIFFSHAHSPTLAGLNTLKPSPAVVTTSPGMAGCHAPSLTWDWPACRKRS